jgi:uncharacterized membrane protein
MLSVREIDMKVRRLTVCCAVFLSLLLLFPIYKANCKDYIEYKVYVRSDGSAAWIITKASDLNGTIDTWEGFQVRIFNLVESAASVTNREMAVDENSLQINTTISSGSKITEYMFVWQNFSLANNGELSFGDVFDVSGFFTQLYGEASVQISYPPNFSGKSASPVPNESDDSSKTMKWYSTQTLVNNKPSILLVITNNDLWKQYAIIGVASVVAVFASLGGFFVYRRRKLNLEISKATIISSAIQVEEGDDQIIGLLKISGGTMRQSAIVEQTKFSKAKTSQLLAALEKKAIITRYKKGRDKIVNLKRTGKGE